MAITTAQLNSWISLFQIAFALGTAVYEGVQNVAKSALTPDELQALYVAWDEDVQRSARNAGIPYNPDRP